MNHRIQVPKWLDTYHFATPVREAVKWAFIIRWLPWGEPGEDAIELIEHDDPSPFARLYR